MGAIAQSEGDQTVQMADARVSLTYRSRVWKVSWMNRSQASCSYRSSTVTCEVGRERATGIEPAFSAWEADVLPLNYARGRGHTILFLACNSPRWGS
jgi:hypothetical protein